MLLAVEITMVLWAMLCGTYLLRKLWAKVRSGRCRQRRLRHEFHD